MSQEAARRRKCKSPPNAFLMNLACHFPPRHESYNADHLTMIRQLAPCWSQV